MKTMFPRKFVEWLSWDNDQVFPVGKQNDGSLKWEHNLEDIDYTLDELYIYWLTEIKDKK